MIFPIKKICCIGAGYVGGPTMAVIANKCPDIEVNVVDINSKRIDAWNSEDLSKLPIYEPGLDQVIEKCRGKNLFFSTDIKKKIEIADMIFISVNTPTKEKGLGAGMASDLRYVEASTRQISEYAMGKTIVVEKSTLPIRTAQTIQNILEVSNKKTINGDIKEFVVLSNPEFLSEGTAIEDLNNPDRILIGGENQKAINALMSIYLRWVNKEKILTTNLWSSELSKLISNAFLAQRISSINSISALCEKTGADIKEVSLAVGSDHRIGAKFLNAGPGFGGSCFKKDISNLVYICKYYGLEEVASYWEKVIDINIWQAKRISEIVIDNLFGTLSQKKIAILGFSFKANTNDIRESPAIKICNELLEEGAILKIYDPKVSEEKVYEAFRKLELNQEQNLDSKKNPECVNSVFEAIEESDAILILTEWKEFENLDWRNISTLMRKPSWVFDTRLITNIKDAKQYGINIWSVGDGK